MARTIASIYDQIIAEKNTQAIIKDTLLPDSNTADNLSLLLAELNSNSRVAIWRLWAFITAACVFFLEKLIDLRNIEVENLIAKAGVGNAVWLRSKIFEFQYSDSEEQIIIVNSNGIITYNAIRTDLQIIKRCAIIENGNNEVTVKLAKIDNNNSPIALNNNELDAVKFYIKNIEFVGTDITAISQAADLLYIVATIYFTGQYAATIKQDVKLALNTYLINNSNVDNFGTDVKVVDIIIAIKNTPGVIDIDLSILSGRDYNDATIDRIVFYDLINSVNTRSYLPQAGYMVLENTFETDITWVAI